MQVDLSQLRFAVPAAAPAKGRAEPRAQSFGKCLGRLPSFWGLCSGEKTRILPDLAPVARGGKCRWDEGAAGCWGSRCGPVRGVPWIPLEAGKFRVVGGAWEKEVWGFFSSGGRCTMMTLQNDPAGSAFPGAGDRQSRPRVGAGTWRPEAAAGHPLAALELPPAGRTAGKLGMSSSSGGMNEPGLEEPTAQSGGSFVPARLGALGIRRGLKWLLGCLKVECCCSERREADSVK